MRCKHTNETVFTKCNYTKINSMFNRTYTQLANENKSTKSIVTKYFFRHIYQIFRTYSFTKITRKYKQW